MRCDVSGASGQGRPREALWVRDHEALHLQTGCYTGHMVKSFRHKGLRRFYETGNAAGVQASHRKGLRLQLSALDTAVKIEDMDIPGFRAQR